MNKEQLARYNRLRASLNIQLDRLHDEHIFNLVDENERLLARIKDKTIILKSLENMLDK